MADVQKENGYTPIAHEILEVIQQHKFTLNELKLIMCVWRFTYGFNRKHHSMSLTFFTNHTGLSRARVNESVKNLIEKKVLIKVQQGGTKSSNEYQFNKDYEQWNIEKYSTFSSNESDTSVRDDTSIQDDTRTSVQDDTRGSVQDDTKERNIKEINKEIYSVFDFWNEKGITKHKELTRARKSAINARLEKHSLEDLLKAIENYDEILKSDMYWYTAKFTLEKFMNPKNLDRFLDANDPFETHVRNEFKHKIPKNNDEIDMADFHDKKDDWIRAGGDPDEYTFERYRRDIGSRS